MKGAELFITYEGGDGDDIVLYTAGCEPADLLM